MEGQGQHHLPWCRHQNLVLFAMALSAWSRSTLGGRISGVQSRKRYHLEKWGEGARGGEEASERRHDHQVMLISWAMATLFPPFLRSHLGTRVKGHRLGGGLGKKPQMWGGAMRWRKGETRALNIADGKKKEKKAHTALFFSFLFLFLFFSFILGQNHHGDVMGEHAQAQPLGGIDVFGEVLIGFQVYPTCCPVKPCCRAGLGFLSPAASSPPG